VNTVRNWKDQLKDVKRALREADLQNADRGEKPAKIDFQPPTSWPTKDRLVSSTDAASTKTSGSAPPGSNSVQQLSPIAIRSSSENPSGRSNRATISPVFRPRLDAHDLTLPDWSGTGRSLQHPDRQHGRAAPMVVRIGADFGTAFTKVVIRAGVDLVPVDWSPVTGDESPMGRFVIPGIVVRGPDGTYCWRRVPGCESQGNLKLIAIDMAGADDCPTATVAYLALVIRYARAFLYRHSEIGRKLVTRSLRWELNIGCPTEPHERPDVVRLFERIARTAWRLAAVEHLQESDIVFAWRADETDTGLEGTPGVVPEFVAQIAGYLVSPQVSKGLHALIDVGAATLDVATFNVVLPNEVDSLPRIPIFFSAVRPLGTHYLNHNRHSLLGLELKWDDAVPVEPAAGFAQRHGRAPSDVNALDSEFVNRVATCITGVIDTTRTNSRGDPRSLAWREGLPIFVTGGGAVCQLYRHAVEEAQALLQRRLGSSTRFRFVEVDPNGANAPELGIAMGERLSVAIGLTQDADNIARVVPHRHIEPIFHTTKNRVNQADIYGDR
jgi:hypothetical protein